MKFSVLLDFETFLLRSIYVLSKPKWSKKAETEESQKQILHTLGMHFTTLIRSLSSSIEDVIIFESSPERWRTKVGQNLDWNEIAQQFQNTTSNDYEVQIADSESIDWENLNKVVQNFKESLLEKGIKFISAPYAESKDLIVWYTASKPDENCLIISTNSEFSQIVRNSPGLVALAHLNHRTLYTQFQDANAVHLANLLQFSINEIYRIDEALMALMIGNRHNNVNTLIKKGKRGIGPATAEKVIKKLSHWKMEDFFTQLGLHELQASIHSVIKARPDYEEIKNQIHLTILDLRAIPDAVLQNIKVENTQPLDLEMLSQNQTLFELSTEEQIAS